MMPPAPSAAPGSPEAGARARVYALTWLTYASYYLGRKGLSVVKATMVRTGVVTEGTLALIDGAYLIAYALGQPASGLLGDRIGARRLLGAGMLVSALACACFGLSTAPAALLVAFTINGFAQSTGWPGTNKAMADWTPPERRGRIMGLWATCYQVGGVAATALASWLLTRHGWRAAFFGPALWLALLAVVVAVALPAGRPRPPPAEGEGAPPGAAPLAAGAGAPQNAASTTAGAGAPQNAASTTASAGAPQNAAPTAEGAGALKNAAPTDKEAAPTDEEAAPTDEERRAARRALVRSTRVWSYGLSYFCIKLIRYGILFWLPYYLVRVLGYPEGSAGYYSTSFEIGGVVGAIAFGLLSDRFRALSRPAWAAIGLGGLAVALGLYQLLAAASPALNFGLMALVGCLLFGPDALLSGVAAQELGGRHAAGAAVGIVNGVGSAGAVLQGFLLVGVSRSLGWSAVFYAFLISALLGALALVPCLRTPRAEPTPA